MYFDPIVWLTLIGLQSQETSILNKELITTTTTTTTTNNNNDNNNNNNNKNNKIIYLYNNYSL